LAVFNGASGSAGLTDVAKFYIGESMPMRPFVRLTKCDEMSQLGKSELISELSLGSSSEITAKAPPLSLIA